MNKCNTLVKMGLLAMGGLMLSFASFAAMSPTHIYIENNCATGKGSSDNLVIIPADPNPDFSPKYTFVDKQQHKEARINEATKVYVCAPNPPQNITKEQKDKNGDWQCKVNGEFPKKGNNTYRRRLFTLTASDLDVKQEVEVKRSWKRIMISSDGIGACTVHTQARILKH